MKKIAMALIAVFGVVAFTACGSYTDSPEQKAFKEFVAKCKKDPSTAACKEWEESKNSPGAN